MSACGSFAGNTGIHIDGIPLGAGFGVEIGYLDEDPIQTAALHPDGTLREPPPVTTWLTRRDSNGLYRRQRRLPPDAHIEATFDTGKRVVYHEHTITVVIEPSRTGPIQPG